MRYLALVAMIGLSFTLLAAEDAASGKKAQGDPVAFSVFAMTNTQSIPVKVTLEAPVGKVIYGPTEIPADGSISIDPKTTNVTSARVVADYGKDHGQADQTITLGGQRNQVYLKTLMASGSIGNVRVTDLAGSNP